MNSMSMDTKYRGPPSRSSIFDFGRDRGPALNSGDLENRQSTLKTAMVIAEIKSRRALFLYTGKSLTQSGVLNLVGRAAHVAKLRDRYRPNSAPNTEVPNFRPPLLLFPLRTSAGFLTRAFHCARTGGFCRGTGQLPAATR